MVDVTHPGGPIIPIEVTCHPTDETGSDANLAERRDRDASHERDF